MLRKENIPGVGEVHILLERPVSNHPGDNHLKYVLAYIPIKGEYVSWILNLEIYGYNNGHYFTDKDDALDDYYER